MKLIKLDHSFYEEHTHLQEVLDLENGEWQKGKVRGYGVVVIEVNSLKFAIPLRSHIKHKGSFPTIGDHSKNHSGLDFSKAILISDDKFLSNCIYKIASDQHKKLRTKERYINKRFSKYVEKYIKAVNNKDVHILTSREYQYSTLINYHVELGIA